MRQRLLVFVALALLLVCLGGTALAADTMDFNLSLSENRLSGPKEIGVTITVKNVGEQAMPGPVTLYYPDSSRIEEFGTPTLAPGEEREWKGTWKVTQEQLERGKLTFGIKYSYYNADGTVDNKEQAFGRTLVYVSAVPEVKVTRTILPTTARKGQTVYVRYEVKNTGTVDISGVTVTDEISDKKGEIGDIPAGGTGVCLISATMGTKNLTSSATVLYMAEEKRYTEKVGEASVKYGNVKLNATLKADKKGGDVGDKVVLTLTLKNNGTTNLENITVTDAVLGTVFTGLKVKKGETVTQTKEVTVVETVDYIFSVKGADTAGKAVETATGRVTVTAVDPNKNANLSVEAKVNKDTIYTLPGVVTFTVSVTNNSAVAMENVTVSSTGVELHTFKTIQPGETRSFVRDVMVETVGQFRFDAAVRNQLGEWETFQGNVIPIAYARPTAVPTEVPIVAPPAPVYVDIPTEDDLPEYIATTQGALSTLFRVLLVLCVAGGALIVAGVVSRVRLNIRSSQADDHLERDGYRDYTRAVSAKQRRMMPEENQPPEDANQPVSRPVGEEMAPNDLPEVKAEDNQVQPEGALMEETLGQLYPRASERAAHQETKRLDEMKPGANQPGSLSELRRHRRPDEDKKDS